MRINSRFGDVVNPIITGIDMVVGEGETIGIVGESGSGKSMTARSLLGLLPKGVSATGAVRYQGRDLLSMPAAELQKLRGEHVAMLFQDPFTMLNPVITAGRHLEEGLGAGRHAEMVRRLAEVGIRDPAVADRYPFQLSGGMRQRVGLAAALARDPKLLLADEPSTALDVTTQKEILALLRSLQRSRGMGMILITHNLRIAFSICDRVYVLYAGSLLEVAPAHLMAQEPLHPYTLGLLLSEPPADRRIATLTAIQGTVPKPNDVTGKCPFAPRCRWVSEQCSAGQPPLLTIEPDRQSACIRIEQIRFEMGELRDAAERRARVALAGRVTDPLLKVDSLAKQFISGSGARRRVVKALDSVSLEVGKRESVGLVGESGSGKTTLARCLLGLETADSGTITMAGLRCESYRSLSRRDRKRLRSSIQIVFQDPYSSLNPSHTIGTTLREVLSLSGVAHDHLTVRLGELLERVGLPTSYASRKPVALSGGERQRVAIARALAVRPQLLVCDEPVSALDVSVQAQILNLFKTLQSDNMSLLFISHDLSVVRQVAERVYVLCAGELVESGPVEEVLDHPRHPYTRKLVDSVPRNDPGWLSSPLQGSM